LPDGRKADSGEGMLHLYPDLSWFVC